MAIGIRAHDLVVQDGSPESLANAASAKGFYSIQLAMAKSFNVGAHPGTLNPGLAHRIGQAFTKKKVRVAVLACYDNIIHPDPKARERALSRFRDHIRYCRDVGSNIVATETGNINSKIVYTEENFTEKSFQDVAESVKSLAEEAEKFGVLLGIEPGVNHPVYSPETMSRLIDEVNSNCLQVILDPVNFLTFENHKDQDKIFGQAFELWGDKIVAIHAKDFAIKGDSVVPVPIGEGLLDYDFLMSKIASRKPELDILLDEVNPEDIDASQKFIRSKMTEHKVCMWSS